MSYIRNLKWQKTLLVYLLATTCMIMPLRGSLIVSYFHRLHVDGIDLSGFKGPYTFNRFCRLADGELWVVGGQGTVQHTTANGMAQKQISNESLNGVHFANRYEGWVVGDNGTIMFTGDNGLVWVPQISETKHNIQAVTCSDENNCWAVGGHGIILRTTNKGNRWKAMKSPISALLMAVSFVSSHTGWVVGEDGIILHTIDGGTTWERQRAMIVLFPDGPFATPTTLRAVKFVDGKHGWVAGTGGLARTVDGGKTWQVKQLDNHAFIGLIADNERTVFAVDEAGANLMTRDGGASWLRVDCSSQLPVPSSNR